MNKLIYFPQFVHIHLLDRGQKIYNAGATRIVKLKGTHFIKPDIPLLNSMF